MWVVEGRYDDDLINGLVRIFRLEEPENIKSANNFKRALTKLSNNILSDLADFDNKRRMSFKSKLPFYAKKWF